MLDRFYTGSAHRRAASYLQGHQGTLEQRQRPSGGVGGTELAGAGGFCPVSPSIDATLLLYNTQVCCIYLWPRASQIR